MAVFRPKPLENHPAYWLAHRTAEKHPHLNGHGNMVYRQLRPGERVVWAGNLTDALGLPVPWLDRQREDVMKAVADLRGRGVVVGVDSVHDNLARLFLVGQVWRETCWKCGEEVNPFLEKCAVCDADTLPF